MAVGDQLVHGAGTPLMVSDPGIVNVPPDEYGPPGVLKYATWKPIEVAAITAKYCPFRTAASPVSPVNIPNSFADNVLAAWIVAIFAPNVTLDTVKDTVEDIPKLIPVNVTGVPALPLVIRRLVMTGRPGRLITPFGAPSENEVRDKIEALVNCSE
jgi:hypothetical protein